MSTLTKRTWKSRSVTLALVGALLLAVVAVSTSAGGPGIAGTPVRLHIGPVALNVPLGGGDDTVTLAATNLSGTTRPVTLKLIDQEGETIESAQRSVPSGETRILVALLLPAVQAVRGLLVATDGGVWRSSLTVEGGTGDDTVAFTDHQVSQARLPDSRSSTALLGLGSDTLTVAVANLSQNVASYRVRFLDADGDVVASRRIEDVAPRAIGLFDYDFEVPSRAAITGPPRVAYLPLGQIAGPSGIVGFPEFSVNG